MKLPPLPTPTYETPTGRVLFTAGMMREYGAACRAAALEEAVGKALEWTEAARKDGREYGVGMDIAAAIRALKEKP